MADNSRTMRILAKISIPSLICTILAGCASSSLVTGQARDAIAQEEVVIYFIDRPACHHATIAYIQVSGGYFTLQSMLDNMRRDAAELGAGGLHVLHTQQSELREFGGTAKAIHCLSG